MQNEKRIEWNFVLKLSNQYGYKSCDFKDDGGNQKYEKFLIDQIEKLNKIKFTSQQKQKIINKITVNSSLSSFDFARFLWGRDSIPLKMENSNIKFRPKFIDFENWENNEFHVAKQVPVQFEEKRILDVVIFINGIPLIIIELKNKDVPVDKAITQLDNYKREILSKGIFRFAQILVASNSLQTKIWANNQEDERVMAFKWAENGDDGTLSEFVEHFLNKNALKKYLQECVVFRNVDRKIVLLRPYQKRAVEKAVNFVKEKLETHSLNINVNKNNGYVWHTTGSGKTVTSFKVAEILSNDLRIDRVIFLLDRIDLSSQTTEEFSQMLKTSVDDLDMFSPPNSQLLYELILKERFIVTTIQKMNWLLSKNDPKLKKITNFKFAFIVDECHRSQFGIMADRIKRYFKNSIMIGFTGTPIFSSKNEEMHTESKFGVRIDVYNILNAIKEKNVLSFSIKDYYQNNASDSFSDTSSNYIEKITEAIEKKHRDFTYNQKYNALFAFDNIAKMLKFYDSLSQIEDLFVTPIFSNLNDAKNYFKKEDSENLEELELGEEASEINIEESRDVLAYKTKILERYNKKFNTSFTPESFDKYMNDVQIRFKKPNSGIDILMVVNMLLTGYDSKLINTLYVAKKMENHNLLQAFSRTNRICDKSKTFGNIINFSLTKETIDSAILLYADKDIEAVKKYIYGKSYQEILEEFQTIWNTVLEWDAKNPSMADVKNINAENFNEYKDLIQQFTKDVTALLKNYSDLKTFPEHDDGAIQNFDKDKLNKKQEALKILKTKWEDQVKKEPKLIDELSVDDFELSDYTEFVINYDYIRKLLSIEKINEDAKKFNVNWIEQIQKHRTESFNLLEMKHNDQEIESSEYNTYKNILEDWYSGLWNLLKKRKSNEPFTDEGLKDLKKKCLDHVIEVQWNKSINKIMNRFPDLNKEELCADFHWRSETKFQNVNTAQFIVSDFKVHKDKNRTNELKKYYLHVFNNWSNIQTVITKAIGESNVYIQ